MSKDEEKELVEIKRRLDYLLTTDEISDSEKIVILKNALEIIENSDAKGKLQ